MPELRTENNKIVSVSDQADQGIDFEFPKSPQSPGVVKFHMRNACGIIVVILGMLISFLVLVTIDFNKLAKKDNELLERHFQERVIYLEHILHHVSASLKSMKSLAELELLETRGQTKINMSLAAQGIAHEPEQDYYHLDIPLPPFSTAMVGNLTGLGEFKKNNPDFLREIQAALALNPLFHSFVQSIETDAWIYYMSARQFLNLYPWVSSKQWRFNTQSYSKEFYTKALFENNPKRNLYWTRVYADELGKGLMTTCGIPIYDRDRFMGIVALDLTVDFLNNIVKNFRNEKGKLFLVNDQGQILAHPDITSSIDPLANTVVHVIPKDLNLVRQDLDLIPANRVLQSGNYLVLRASLVSAPWQVIYFEQIPGLWTLFKKRVGLETIFLFFGLLVLVIIILVSTHYFYVMPSDKFIKFILGCSQGRRDNNSLDVPGMWQPWFDNIGKIFSQNRQLNEKIRQHSQELEDRVEQRTKELSQLNTVLNGEIVERKRAQNEAQHTARILDQAISQSPSGIVIVDAFDISLHRINKAALEIRRQIFPDLSQMDFKDPFNGFEIYDKDRKICPEDQWPLNRAIRRQELVRGEEMILMDAEGREHWISVNAAPINDKDGNIEAGIIIFHDISFRKQMEAELEESKNQYKMLSDASFEAIFLSENGICSGQNMRAEKMFGYTLEEAVGRPGIRWIEKESRQFVVHKMLSGCEAPYESVAIRKDGSSFPCEIQARTITKGNVNIRVTALREITARKQAEQEKLEAQKIALEQAKDALVGKIAGKMAHDFNNILGVIMGNVELALMEEKDKKNVKVLELVLGQTIRGKNLTKNLVAFARDQEPRQESFNINKKIDLVLDLLKKELAPITLMKRYNSNMPRLVADSGMIEHMLVNLLQNSIHALGKTASPLIVVWTWCKDDAIWFEIEDNGCGIPEKYLDHIYEPSFTLKGSRDLISAYSRDIRGTGYGMANVKKYIEQHKGMIWVKSRRDKGTKFTISLPLLRGEIISGDRIEIKSSNQHTGMKILLVEDESAISNIQYNVLTRQPCCHKVDLAENGQKAMELFEKNQYDFVSLDYLLAGNFNGIDVYHHIRKTNRIIPILFVSGNIEFLESIKKIKQQDSFVDHLSKPCLNKDYINSINGLVEKKMLN